MSSIVAIAGGTGGLGRALAEAFKASKYTPYILARKANPELEKEIGVPVIVVDYSNQESLVRLLEDRNIDTVISAISNYDNSHSVEPDLIKAADRSKATHRFIPSIWSGFDYTTEQGKENPLAASRLVLFDALRETKLQWTAIFPGIFLDFYALTVRAYVKKSALGIDIDGNAAAIPGDGKYPIYFTHSLDLAKYTVALLGLDKWEEKYYVYADKKTWPEVIAIAEEAKGVKFTVAYDSIEKLKRGEVTELPGHRDVYKMVSPGPEGKAIFQQIMSGVAVYMAQGYMVYEGPFLNEIFPDIKPLTVETALLKDGRA